MHLAGYSFSASDLVPPIFTKAYRRWISSQPTLPRPFRYLPHSLRVRWMLDLGANIGEISLAALKTYPDCRVVCFEPAAKTFAALEQTLAPYADRVTLRRQAVGDEDRMAVMHVSSHHPASSLLPQPALHHQHNPRAEEIGEESVEIVRLDTLADQLPAREFDLVKIDVEGFELQALQGGRRFFAERVNVILIEIALDRFSPGEDERPNMDRVFTELTDLGFVLVNIVDLFYSEPAGGDARLNQFDCVFQHRRFL